MIHYHGGPITPEACAVQAWSRRHAFVSWAEPRGIGVAATVCQSFALDNGAFSLWTRDEPVDWDDYYLWCEDLLPHPACDWAVIPDVIGGSEDENDALLDDWPFRYDQGVPVWHMDESLDRLERLALEWPRIALGSAASYDVRHLPRFLSRAREAVEVLTDDRGRLRCKLHGLRMLNPEITTRIPLSSADSTNVARNIGDESRWSGTYAPRTPAARAEVLIDRIESFLTPGLVEPGAILQELF